MTGNGVADGMTWGGAALRALGILVAAFVLFVLLPNQLLAYLSLHIVPRWRDFMMGVYLVGAFVVGCWMFVRLQRGRT
jgi:hypothetical protein